MRLFEVAYLCHEGKDRKARVIASHSAWAMTEMLEKRHGRNQIVSVVDQGAVIIAEPRRATREALLSRTVQIGAIMDAIDDEIASIEVDFERHRKTMDQITRLKARLAVGCNRGEQINGSTS
jgi:hypothetical protein